MKVNKTRSGQRPFKENGCTQILIISSIRPHSLVLRLLLLLRLRLRLLLRLLMRLVAPLLYLGSTLTLCP